MGTLHNMKREKALAALQGPVSLSLSDQPKFTRPELLLHLPIPASLGGVNPRTIEGKEWWDTVRSFTYAENNHCCFACGTFQTDVVGPNQWLEAHECYDYDFERLVITFREVVALCPYCHKFIHWMNVTSSPKTTRAILKHGLRVLRGAGVKYPNAQHWYLRQTYYWRDREVRELVEKESPKAEWRPNYIKLRNENWLLHYKGVFYDWTGTPGTRQ